MSRLLLSIAVFLLQNGDIDLVSAHNASSRQLGKAARFAASAPSQVKMVVQQNEQFNWPQAFQPLLLKT